LLAVFTHTKPLPPPGAAGLAAAACAGLSLLPDGVVAGATAPALAAGVGAGAAAGGVVAGTGAGAAATPGLAVPVAGATAYQVCTPLCPWQAPLLLAAVE
jgi:hypothetical protein